jgi:hypothetical protein
MVWSSQEVSKSDTGASTTHQAGQCGAEDSWTTPAQILKHLDIVAPNINVWI